MNLRHITRFTYKFTNFQGWRVAIRRQGYTLTRYFSDRQYEDEDAAYEQAIQFRDMVLAELDAHPGEELAILTKHRAQPRPLYPAGLKPSAKQDVESPTDKANCACSVRSNKVMQTILKKVCRKLQLDTASVFKLSLYLFSMQYGCAAASPLRNISAAEELSRPALHREEDPSTPQPDLHRLIEELELTGRSAGLPSFEEFATGKVVAERSSAQQEEDNTPTEVSPTPASPSFVTIPGRCARSSIAYFKHFYNSPFKQMVTPLPPIAYSAPHNGVTGQHHPDLKVASAPPTQRNSNT
ncbi:MAG: hypothetical protein E7031_08345 [Akkermansiaceae bacterium]|nr:hypothetical protein [Akkermansiaceae bacterium]